jgi:transcriptional regulator with XRE-family HTH domain
MEQQIAELNRDIAPLAGGGAAGERDAALALHQLRRKRGLPLREVAARLAVGRPAVAKIERRAGIRVANLRRYVEALGGRLTITAEFADGSVRIAEGP